jgi:seryl-tRNA synthetase
MIRERVMEGAGFLPDGREDIYKIEDEDLFAVGTSEQALAGLHEGDILEAQQLPIFYTGISPCFRTEAGSHGRDTKGIFRVHQFEKVEMFIFSLPENSWSEIERMRAIAEGLFRDLNIPFRVVNVCTGELSSVVAKRYDLEAWLPGQNKYREMVSCSNCLDYQARRLRVRYREAPGKPTSFVHTLNSTALASTRTLIAIMENHQTAEGHIAIPRVLRPYLPGIDIIKRD